MDSQFNSREFKSNNARSRTWPLAHNCGYLPQSRKCRRGLASAVTRDGLRQSSQSAVEGWLEWSEYYLEDGLPIDNMGEMFR